jgi:hypothetical protein
MIINNIDTDLIHPFAWFGRKNPVFLQNFMDDWWRKNPNKGRFSTKDLDNYFAPYGQIVYNNDSEVTFEFKDSKTLTWFIMNWS